MSDPRPDPRIPEAEAERRIATDNRDIQATLAKADHRLLAGDLRAAAAFYGAVGRLAGQGVDIERGELLRARGTAQWIDGQFARLLLDGLKLAGLSEADWHPRFRKSLEIMLGRGTREPSYQQFPQVPLSYYYPGTDYCQFANAGPFDWCEPIETATAAIVEEGLAILADHTTFKPYLQQSAARPQGDVHGLMDNPDWSTWYLTDKGEPMPERIARCPASYAAIADNAPLCQVPERAPTIMFSLLRPRSRIPPHTGMLNTRFICHLPLIVPPGGALRVGSETREWQVGQLMVFDDTVEHEAWNDSDHDRLVLIFDVWRPEISLAEREQIATLFAVVNASAGGA